MPPQSTNNKQNTTYTFQDLDHDLSDLYKLLKNENYTNNEIKNLFSPITSKLVPIPHPKTEKIIFVFSQTLLIIFSLILIIHLLTYWDTFYWNLTAVTRIIMIKILPYFDWTHLKNEVCLVPKFYDQPDQKISPQKQAIFNCDLCESLNSFEEVTFQYDDQKIEDLIYKFLDIDRPIIVNGGIDHWMKESARDFIDQFRGDDEFWRSIPCRLSTNVHNLRKDDVDVGDLIEKSEFFDRFFMHFQNCELGAMKIFRKYTYRPKMLPAELSPINYNWVLWSKNYNSTKTFKKIELVEKYTLIGQIVGKTRINLIPRENCAKVCPVLDGILSAGHFMVFTSLWDLEYQPNVDGESLAAILEIKG